MKKSSLTKTVFAFNLAVGIGVTLFSGCRNPRILSDRGLVPRAYAKPMAVAQTNTAATTSTEPILPFANFSSTTPVAIENPVSFAEPTVGKAQTKAEEKTPVATGIKLPETPKTTLLTHTVGKNECLSSIAVNYGVSWKSLAAFNKIENPDKIKEGMVLTIPPGGYPIPAEKRKPRKTTGKTKATSLKLAGKAGVHVVKQGEYLGKIAQMYGMKTADLKKLNGFTAKNPVLMVGQKIKVVGKAKVATESKTKKEIPMLKATKPAETKDDQGTLGTVNIEKKSPAATEAKDVPEKTEVTEDDTGEATVTTTADKAIESLKKLPHVVCEGETLEKLAKMYITKKEHILKANPGIKTDADLEVGKQIIILY